MRKHKKTVQILSHSHHVYVHAQQQQQQHQSTIIEAIPLETLNVAFIWVWYRGERGTNQHKAC